MDLLTHMATFVRIVDMESLSAAARAQGLSLAAVSRQLRALEQDLGVALIRRSTRRFRVTEAGQSWYEHSVRILSDIENARADVAEAPSVGGLLTVSAPVSLGLSYVMPRLAGLLKRYPSLAIDMRLEDHLVDPCIDAVDLVVRGGSQPPDSPSLVATPLFTFSRLVVASPAYLRKHDEPKNPRALIQHECLVQLGASGPLATWRFGKDGDEQAVQVRGTLRLSAPLAIREAALAGLGIAMLPDWLVSADLAERRLQRIFSSLSSGSVTVWALYRRDLRQSPRVSAFIEELQKSGKS
mgnify:CR=1 FL=1